MSETLQIFGEQFTNVTGIKAYKPDGTEVVFGSDGVSWDDIAARSFAGDIVIPNATSIKAQTIYQAPYVTSVSAPNVTSLGGSAIYGNTGLTSINLPNLVTSGNYGLARNTSTNLKAIVLPKMTTTGTYLLEWVKATLDFTALSQLVTNSLRSWYGPTLILRKSDAICTLNATGAFTGTVFASGGTGGTLYVPQVLISDYQSATNWSTILGYENNQILPIEGSIYETQYADGTPIE